MVTTAPFTIQPAPDLASKGKEILLWARGEIERVQAWMAEANAPGKGFEVVRAQSDVIDTVMEQLFAWVDHHTPGSPLSEVCLVAQGGYGRRQLCLHSDVDVMLLTEETISKETEKSLQLFIQMLWDLGNEPGTTTKTIREALAVVGDDFVQATALFEARPLAGKTSLCEELHENLTKRLKREGASKYLHARMAEMRGRHEKWGNTVYLLEPNLKDGEGGLRDVHVCQWIAFVCLGTTDLSSLVKAEVLTDAEIKQLIDAWDFLIVVRNALHAICGRRVDTLDFSRQRAVAKALKISGDQVHELAEEKLLHLCHVNAKTIERLSERVFRLLPARTSMASRLAARLRSKRIRGGWLTLQGEIGPDPSLGPEIFLREPGMMLEVCAVARERGLALSEETREMIRTALPACDDEFRRDAQNTSRFLRIMQGPAHTASIVRAMADTGLLETYMPEFARIQSMVRADHYHRYTVDEHTLKCLETAEALITGKLDEREAGLAEASHQIERWDLLMFGLLLHDIGKGEGKGHVVRGGQIAQRIAQRMGLDTEEAETLRTLVLGHLWFPHLAFRRDTSDPAVIERLAQQVGTVEMLRMLFVLTFADITGVNPENWTAWKGQLIWDLYRQTRAALDGSDDAQQSAGVDTEALAQRVLEHAGGDEALGRRAHALIQSAPERYHRTVAPEDIATHARMLLSLNSETHVVWRVTHPERCNYSEITFAAFDEIGVFSLLCGALASKDLNILSSQIYSTDDGYAIDVFQVVTSKGGPLPEGFVIDRVGRLINQVLRGEVPADEAFPVSLGPISGGRDRLERAPTQISVDNTASAQCTVLEVKTHDRRGLLHALTHLLAKMGYTIKTAMISTESYRVVDVLYLTDLENMKIDDPKKLESLEQALTEMLDVSES